MATIAAMNSGFDFYTPLPIQNSIAERIVREITPLNAIQPGSPLEFMVLGGEGDSMYLDLAQSYFYFRIKVQTSGDANPDAAAEVSCAQNLGHSMWQRFQVFLGDKEIGDSNALYPYRAYIANLLSRGKLAQETWMYSQGWYERDTAGKLDVVRTTEAEGTNLGLRARHLKMGKGEETELWIHPVHELFHTDKFILPGVPLKVRFTPAQSSFVLTRGAGNDESKLVLLEAKFYCATVKATAAQDLAVMSALRDVGPIRYSLNCSSAKHLSVAQGKTTADLDNIYYGPIPNRVLIGMVRDDALAGNYGLNAFDFNHFNLDEIVLVVNGKFNPSTPLKPDFTTKRYIRVYNSFLQGLNKANTEFPVPITYKEYGEGYTFFPFDLTPDQNCELSHSPQGTGSVRLIIKFKQALARSTDILLIAEGDGYAEIDKFKNVSYYSPL